jgi:ferrous iron transport protein B
MRGPFLLSEIETGKSVYIKTIRGEGAFRQRIGEMGFVKGTRIKVIKNAPMNDPIEFNLMGYNVSLRRQEASLIEVAVSAGIEKQGQHTPTAGLTHAAEYYHGRSTIHVAIVGNPNAGKTTIFNYASGSREHVGNYTGVTVDSKTASVKLGAFTLHLTDLPGTYSLSAYSPEELFVREFILEKKPDVVVNIVDAANLERNLYLTTQLIDMNVKVVVALNMYDEMIKNRDRFDYMSLGRMTGIPFVPTVGARGKGIHRLFQKVVDVYTGKDLTQRAIIINYGTEVELTVQKLSDCIVKHAGNELQGVPPRFIALRLINRDRHIESLILNLHNYHEIMDLARSECSRIETLMGDSVESVITDARYGFIHGALKETFRAGPDNLRKTSERIDYILTHKYLGFPIFLFFLWAMFTVTFTLGGYPQDWIENGVGMIAGLVDAMMPAGSLKQLLTEGIIGGVGGVIVFLPNILILFFFISLMEDTGYMARAAFITDKLMHKIGLHGKSFIPLVMGFGCNVPAIMATRTIENRNNRLLTMLINPFMSCSARLPVYILLIGAVFPDYKGTMLFLIYLTGIAVAIGLALLFKNTLFRAKDAPFVMELPPYRMPTSRSAVKHMWSKASQYLKKMGGVIMVASVLIWALGHYPEHVAYSADFEKEMSLISQRFQQRSADLQPNSAAWLSLEKERDNSLHALQIKMRSEQQQNSYIGRVGRFIEPVIEPLGFDWRMGICLLTGIAAKEIVVSTMGVIYLADDADDSPHNLEGRLRSTTYSKGPREGEPVFTPLATLSFIIFTLLYFPCIATIAAIYKESGSWKWAAFVVVYTTGLAWLFSFAVFSAGKLFI